MSHSHKQGTPVPATVVSDELHETENQMRAAKGISTNTRKWLIALAMTQDLLTYIRDTYNEARAGGIPLVDHYAELLQNIKSIDGIIDEYLIKQIHLSILGLVEDNISLTGNI